MTGKGNEKNGQWPWQWQRKRQKQGQVKNQVYSNYSGLKSISSQNLILLLSSGIFLGLTIFTKVPAITLIPLVGFIVFTNNKKSFKAPGLWIIPVILIPLIWPIHALSSGNMESWLDDVIWQATESPESTLDNSLRDLLRIDPVLMVLGQLALFMLHKKGLFYLAMDNSIHNLLLSCRSCNIQLLGAIIACFLRRRFFIHSRGKS